MTDTHRATIVDDFLTPDAKHAECSCGWVGEPASVERLALTEWAAHVHTAEGRTDDTP